MILEGIKSNEAYRGTHLHLRVINLRLIHFWMHLNHFSTYPFHSAIYSSHSSICSKGILEKHCEYHSWIGPIHYDFYPERCEALTWEILEELLTIPFSFDVLLASSGILDILLLNKYYLSASTAVALDTGMGIMWRAEGWRCGDL